MGRELVSAPQRPIEEARHTYLHFVGAALLRAAQRARADAIRTRTPLVVCRDDGSIELLEPWNDEDVGRPIGQVRLPGDSPNQA